MLRRVCAVATALFLCGAGVAEGACTTTWISTDGLWSEGVKWDNGVPDATDDVCIPAGSGTVTLSTGTVSVRSLQLARTLSISTGATLTMTGTSATNTSQLTTPAAVSGGGQIHYDAAATTDKTAAGDVLITVDQLDLDGAVNINAGSLTLGIGADGVDTHDGTFTLANGTTFAIGSGGFGTHVFGGTVTDGANAATVTNGSGNLVTFSGTFSVNTLTNSGNLNFDGTATPQTINTSGGNLGGTANYSVATALNWSGGNLTGTGTTTVPSSATFDLQTATAKGLSRTLLNDTAVALDVAGLSVSGTFDNRSGSTFTISDDQDVGGGGVFAVRSGGTLAKNGAGDAEITPDINWDGAVNINAGTLSTGIGSDTVDANAGTVTLASNATLAIGPGGFGNHVFSGTVTDGANAAHVTNGTGNLLTFSGTFAVNTLTNTGNMNLDGTASPTTINLNGGNLNGSASYTVASSLNWFAGTLGGTGTTTIPSSGGLDFTSANAKTLSRTLLNDAATTLDVAGLSVTGTFDNRSGSTFTFSDDQDVGGGGAFFVRSGATLAKNGAGNSEITPDIEWDGAVNVNGGTLGTGIGSDTISANGGTITLANGTTLAIGPGGFGTHVFSGTVTDGANSATITNGTGNQASFSGPLTVNTLTNTGNLLLTSATVAFDVLNFNGGQIIGGSNFTVAQSFNWSAGTLGGFGGTTTIPSGSAVVFSSVQAKSLTDGRILRNETTTFQPPSDSTLTIGGSAALDNAGTLTFPDDRDLNVVSSGAVRNLAGGTLRKTGGIGVSSVRLTQNAGTVDVQTGVLQIDGTYTQTAGLTTMAQIATFNTDAISLDGGTLGGTGIVEGPVTNNGGVVDAGASPGALTLNGNYTQGPGGTLRAEIAGTTPETEHDQVSVVGSASLDGTLAIVNDPGFAPDEADTFEVLNTTATLSGTFATLTGATTSTGVYEANYAAGPPGTVILSVGPLPPPQNTTPPSIPQAATVGDTLTCDPGTWTGSPGFAFQWLRDGAAIDGATTDTYVVAAGDAGATIVCRVTGTNTSGQASADSNGVVPAAAQAPGGPPPPVAPPAVPPPPEETVRGQAAFTQGTSNDLYLACTRLDLLLVDVLPAGRRVSVTGTADVRLVGQTVEILLDGRPVGRATIGAAGNFAARVRAPAARRRARARYQARVGTTVSQQLRLVRRMVATTLTRSGSSLVLRGRIARPFSRRAVIEVERFLSCSRRERVQVARVVPTRSGTFAVRIPVPSGAAGVMYRARTRVPRRAGGPLVERTFTLPRAIDLV